MADNDRRNVIEGLGALLALATLLLKGGLGRAWPGPRPPRPVPPAPEPRPRIMPPEGSVRRRG